MTLVTIYYIGQTIAVIAILASLSALFFQIRQSNRLARTEMSLSTWFQYGQLQSSYFSTQEDADFMDRAVFKSAPISDAEKNRLAVRLATLVSSLEVMYILRGQGLAQEEMFERMKAITVYYFRSPRVRHWWRRARDDYFLPPFSDVIDEMVRQIEAAIPKPDEGVDAARNSG